MKKTRKPNFFLAALLMPANLFAVFAGGIAAIVTGDWFPLVAAGGAAGAYMALLSTTPTFRRAVRANFDAQQIADGRSSSTDEGLLAELSPSQRQHFEILRRLEAEILERYRRMPGGRVLAASSEGRLGALLTSFLRLVTTLNGYRTFLSSVDRKGLDAELKSLEEEMVTDVSVPLREVKGRRIDILKKRINRFAQAEEAREVVSHQLASIEDMLRLTHEQAIAIRDPIVADEQLQALSAEVTATEDTVKEMESFMLATDVVSSHPALLPRVREPKR